ncbi:MULTISPECIES: alpha/beta hydrolase domain-containing protein [Pseudofrankia]|uniref:alpha/beta hydrolase domain-containing protein n=1 Tax=Pseudofrankia TaxID=2994363 RepID=UPI000234C17F|nr:MULTISPECIES: alpha/beta hydrolase domain-containing protein [Pseudofrankia]
MTVPLPLAARTDAHVGYEAAPPEKARPGRPRRLRDAAAVFAVATVVAGGAAACSGSAIPGDGHSPAPAGSEGTAAQRRPAVPAAALSGPATGGAISEPVGAGPDLAAHGYAEQEYFAAGTATAYTAVGALGADGAWRVNPSTTAPYKTRLIVRRPANLDEFTGTVVVEWLNETAGVDTSAEWTSFGEEVMRSGSIYVGLSVQALGVVGGKSLLPIPGAPPAIGIRGTDPERYGSLAHPGDRYAFDILSQVGAALRAPGDVPALGGAHAARLLAAGESQSAFFMTTYVNAVHPVANVYDGFFIHSRAGSAASLDGMSGVGGSGPPVARIRSDLNAKVFIFETETDVGPTLGYAVARQDDTDQLRTWEVAGTAHADASLTGSPDASGLGCPGRINTGPQHYVASAAFAALVRWVTDGTQPPRADPLVLNGTGTGATLARDARGIARGGVRTPPVDVPVAVLSGDPSPDSSSVLCSLFGSTTPFDAATLASLYPTRDSYLSAFDKSLDGAIAARFLLEADRAALAAEARAVPLTA